MAAIKTRMKTRHFLLSPRYNSQTCIFGTANSRCSPPTNNGWHAEIFFSTHHCIFVSLVPSPFYPALGQRGWPAAVVVVLRCCSHGGGSSSCCCWSRCCDFRACSGDVARRPWGAAAALQQRERRHILAWGPQPKTLVPGFCLLLETAVTRSSQHQRRQECLKVKTQCLPHLPWLIKAFVASAVTHCWHWVSTNGKWSSSACSGEEGSGVVVVVVAVAMVDDVVFIVAVAMVDDVVFFDAVVSNTTLLLLLLLFVLRLSYDTDVFGDVAGRLKCLSKAVSVFSVSPFWVEQTLVCPSCRPPLEHEHKVVCRWQRRKEEGAVVAFRLQRRAASLPDAMR